MRCAEIREYLTKLNCSIQKCNPTVPFHSIQLVGLDGVDGVLIKARLSVGRGRIGMCNPTVREIFPHKPLN